MTTTIFFSAAQPTSAHSAAATKPSRFPKSIKKQFPLNENACEANLPQKGAERKGRWGRVLGGVTFSKTQADQLAPVGTSPARVDRA